MDEHRVVTGDALIGYLDSATRERTMNAGTANSRRSAVREVLNVAFGDAWATSAFRSSDVGALLTRFADERKGDFTPETIQSYRSNFRRTVELMLDDETAGPTDDWMIYRFPIRHSAVELRLPVDLTVAEAQRLATLITALPVSS